MALTERIIKILEQVAYTEDEISGDEAIDLIAELKATPAVTPPEGLREELYRTVRKAVLGFIPMELCVTLILSKLTPYIEDGHAKGYNAALAECSLITPAEVAEAVKTERERIGNEMISRSIAGFSALSNDSAVFWKGYWQAYNDKGHSLSKLKQACPEERCLDCKEPGIYTSRMCEYCWENKSKRKQARTAPEANEEEEKS